MSWIGFNHNKLIFIFHVVLLTTACSYEQNDEGNSIEKQEEIKQSLTEEQKIIRQVESRLDISAAEDYDIQIQYKYINPDTLKDALILVNRKEYAFQKAKDNNTERFFENTGHTGPYNYVFVKLGGSKDLISTTPVGSNAEYPLKAEFLELTSKAHKDFYVEYRVRNSMHRNYYTLRNNSIFLTFSCPVFDSIGAPRPRVYNIEHKNSSVRLSKDIALYEGKIVDYNPDKISNLNGYEPKDIVRNGKLVVYFIFDNKSMKYKTPMPAMER